MGGNQLHTGRCGDLKICGSNRFSYLYQGWEPGSYASILVEQFVCVAGVLPVYEKHKKNLRFICMGVCVCVPRGQRRMMGTLKLEEQAVLASQ